MINICIIATIVIYLVGMLLVGFVYSKSNEDSSDFYLGGRTKMCIRDRPWHVPREFPEDIGTVPGFLCTDINQKERPLLTLTRPWQGVLFGLSLIHI